MCVPFELVRPLCLHILKHYYPEIVDDDDAAMKGTPSRTVKWDCLHPLNPHEVLRKYVMACDGPRPENRDWGSYVDPPSPKEIRDFFYGDMLGDPRLRCVQEFLTCPTKTKFGLCIAPLLHLYLHHAPLFVVEVKALNQSHTKKEHDGNLRKLLNKVAYYTTTWKQDPCPIRFKCDGYRRYKASIQ